MIASSVVKLTVSLEPRMWIIDQTEGPLINPTGCQSILSLPQLHRRPTPVRSTVEETWSELIKQPRQATRKTLSSSTCIRKSNSQVSNRSSPEVEHASTMRRWSHARISYQSNGISASAMRTAHRCRRWRLMLWLRMLWWRTRMTLRIKTMKGGRHKLTRCAIQCSRLNLSR